MKNLRILTFAIALTAMTLPAVAEFLPTKVNPADGTTLERLGKITADWDTEWLDDYTSDICGEIKNSEGEVVSTLTCEIEFLDPICYFNPEMPITDFGDYTVVIYANTVQSAEGEWNDQFELHYKIGEETQTEFFQLLESNPENNSTVASLSEIETIWSEVVEEINSDLTVSVYDAHNLWVADMSVNKGAFSGSPSIFLSLTSPIEIDGEYSIRIPEGLLKTSNGYISEAVELNFTVDITTGVKNINIDDYIMVEKNRIISNAESEIVICNIDGLYIAKIPGKGEITVDEGVYIIYLTNNGENYAIKLHVK